MTVRAIVTLGFLLASVGGAQAAPQADSTRQPAEGLRAYLDCQTMGCDRDFFVTEITFVNWTRDRTDADIHVLITALETKRDELNAEISRRRSTSAS